MSNKSHIWGIDLGGTKIEGVVLDRDKLTEPLCRIRIDTEAEQGYEHVVSRILHLLEKMKSETGLEPDAVGIGTPGTTDPYTHLLKNSNSTHLNGKPLWKDLERREGVKFVMANDANCFALAEARLGIVQDVKPDAQIVFGVIMGTGVGGGVVVNGRVINGHQGIAGEWGHNFLDESGGACYCGNSGCVEKILAGPSLERYYESISGEKKRLRDIVANRLNDPFAEKTIDRLVHFFGKGIASVINILDPEVIVIGGGVGNIDDIYDRGVKSATKFAFNTYLETRIVRPKLGDSAGVFGAALLTI
ncbi:ROK family protein [Fulvivirga sedimenti]|uniref:ROK family protein n=1 Tax=Fulvivirga sedimenti TaxID=2879465 RepID=A0A9X1L2D2_9BACT|nr:ROK family protein [Fulvivirga sedimenti]MCA6079172.1 ROK family protein [Fulvivirga sedimenti]